MSDTKSQETIENFAGFPWQDMSGWKSGQLSVISALPGSGKSNFTLNLIIQQAKARADKDTARRAQLRERELTKKSEKRLQKNTPYASAPATAPVRL
jgi:hypothetical protein